MTAFTNKVVLVTGGSRGIGKGIATGFAEAGAKVVISGRNPETLEALAGAYPDHISCVAGDVTSPDDRAALIEAVVQRHDRLDVLVNNAGVAKARPIVETTDEEAAFMLDLNLIAPVALIRLAQPHLAKSGGSIINISSIAGRNTTPGAGVYSATKAALDHLTRIAAIELGPAGIRVNAVSPGVTQSDMADEMLSGQPGAMEMIANNTPFGRIGEPADIARVVMLLAGDDAGWVTGQIVEASGGFGL